MREFWELLVVPVDLGLMDFEGGPFVASKPPGLWDLLHLLQPLSSWLPLGLIARKHQGEAPG